MTDIAVIILVGQEKLHIRRCLERLNLLEPRQVFVVESQPSDGTHDIAVEMGAVTTFNKWPGLYAKQFNWALDNLPIKAKWVLRLDADEYLTDDGEYDDYDDLNDDEEFACDEDEDYYEIECPSCGEKICFTDDLEIEELVCPACGESVGDVEVTELCDGDCEGCTGCDE